MRPLALTFVRLGASWVYMMAAVFVASMVLLGAFPSSPMVWALYITILPLVREPLFLLLSLPGVNAEMVLAVMASAAIFGVYLSFRPQRFLRARFIHAHLALIVLVLAKAPATSAQAGTLGAALPQLPNWSLIPMAGSSFEAVLIGLAALACLSSHVAIIRRVRARAEVC